jgi:hypothetical protein
MRHVPSHAQTPNATHDGASWGCVYYGIAVYCLVHTVVETPPYLADAERLFSDDERAGVVNQVSAEPRCGVVIPGTGGLRKLRFASSGRGKRGGARVVYLFSGQDLPVFLLAVFAKNEKSDLSPAERRSLAKMTTALLEEYRSRQ